MAATFPIDAVPATLGATDRIPSRRQRLIEQGAEEHNAPREVLISQRAQDLERILSSGDLKAFVFWAKRTNPQKATELREVLREALESDNKLLDHAVSLIFYGSEGCAIKDVASELRKEVVLQAAKNEVSYDL